MTEYWDATRIAAVKSCPAKAQMRLEQGWQPKQLSIHLAFGQAFAKGIEVLGQTDSIEDALEAALAYVLPKHKDKTPETLCRSLVWYAEEYAKDEIYTLASGKKAVELSFQVEVADGIVFCGHLDKVVVMGGDLYILDQKTTGRALNEYYFRQFQLSDQVMMYSFVAKEILGSPIRGIIIDAVHITAETTQFQRQPVAKTKQTIDEWYHDTIDWITAYPIIKGTHNFTSCQGAYGACDYIKVCTASPGVRDAHLKGSFEQQPRWQPEEAR